MAALIAREGPFRVGLSQSVPAGAAAGRVRPQTVSRKTTLKAAIRRY